VAAGQHGEVWWLTPDLSPRWEQAFPNKVVAAALDPFGQYLALGDTRSQLYFVDRQGRRLSQIESPRPFHHLAFVPAAPYLLGCSDYALVACLELHGTPGMGAPPLRWIWRDGLVAHIGALAVSGDGETILLPCFTDGLQRYSLAGKKLDRIPVSEPCSLAAVSFDGRLTVVAGLSSRIQVLDEEGKSLTSFTLERPALALTVTALGDQAFVALTAGGIAGLAIGTS
jgi:hypothetical protein